MFQSLIEDIKRYLPSYKLQMEKNNLRAVLQQKRRMLTEEQVKKCSEEVVEQIFNNKYYQKAKTILIYYPIENEIDLLGLVELSPEKCFLLPVVHRKSIEVRQYVGEDSLKRGKFGIPEPQTEEYKGKIDLIIAPAVGFDRHLVRLGRGGGYYDRFIDSIRYAKKIGVGYNFQMVNRLPHQRHDKRMDDVILSSTK